MKPVPRLKAAEEEKENCGPEDVPAPAADIERVMGVIDGKWKVLIVLHLTAQKICRFGELRRKLPRVTQRMLTLQLREMERDGLVTRTVYAEVPPRVEYSLTDTGRDLKSVYMAIRAFAKRHPDVPLRPAGSGSRAAAAGSRAGPEPRGVPPPPSR